MRPRRSVPEQAILQKGTMAGRGPQSFKKRQKEQLRKERQLEKLAKKQQRREAGKTSGGIDGEPEEGAPQNGMSPDETVVEDGAVQNMAPSSEQP